jgi:hypothetical protein
MPPKDSLLLKLKELDFKISALTDSTNKIKAYTDYQLETHYKNQSIYSYWEFWAAVSPFLIWICIQIYLFIRERKTPKDLINEHTKNFMWVFIWLASAGFIVFTLYLNGEVHFPKAGFMISELDLILTISTIIAIVGAVWAIYARIDAERAFNKSQETLNALGATFPFYDILNKDKVSDIISFIGKDNCDISLFLGFPIIGYLYDEKEKLQITPNKVLGNLYTNIVALINNISDLHHFKFHISLFSPTDSDNLITTYGIEKGLSADEVLKIKKDTANFYEKANELLNLSNNNITINLNMGKNENLRFASIKHLKSKSSFQDNKSIIWVVKNLTTTCVSFNSSCFQTSDKNLLDIVQTVFS